MCRLGKLYLVLFIRTTELALTMLRLPRGCSTWYDTTALVLKPLWAILDGLGDLGNSLVACPAQNGIAQETIGSWSCLPAPGFKMCCVC
jgi:hypothetical protein